MAVSLLCDLDLVFAKPTGLDWISSVDSDVFDGKLEAEYLVPYLADPHHWLLLAWSSGRVIGKCSAIVHLRPDQPRELYMDEIDVTPSFRGRGVAKAMLARVLEEGHSRDILECWVGTESENVPARALYESLEAKAEPFVLYYLRV
jgi:ribosomal protein S18 acetylase RimI-like enzyme